MKFAVALSLASHGFGIAAFDWLPYTCPSQARQATAHDPNAVRVNVRPAAVVERPSSAHGSSPTQSDAASPSAPRTGKGGKPLYYPAHLLDERPQVRVHVEPLFPPHATQEEGRVRLQLFISENGLVDEVALLEDDAPPDFQAAAANAFARAIFTPGRLAGRAVKSTLAIEVLFGTPVPVSSPHARADAPR